MTQKYIKLVDLSKDKNKIDGLLLLADGIGKTMKGEALEEDVQNTGVEHRAPGPIGLFPFLERRGGGGVLWFALWWKLKSACCTNYFGSLVEVITQLQGNVNSSC